METSKNFNHSIFRGQVYYAKLEDDGTSKQCGVRPILVVSNNAANRFSPIITVIALTSQHKHSLPTHIYISAQQSGLAKDSIALCEQPMSFPKDKLLNYVTSFDDDIMKMVAKGLKAQLALA